MAIPFVYLCYHNLEAFSVCCDSSVFLGSSCSCAATARGCSINAYKTLYLLQYIIVFSAKLSGKIVSDIKIGAIGVNRKYNTSAHAASGLGHSVQHAVGESKCVSRRIASVGLIKCV